MFIFSSLSCKFESIHFCKHKRREFLLKIVKKSKEISKFMTLHGRNKFFLVSCLNYLHIETRKKTLLLSRSKIYVRQARTECNSNVDQYFSSNMLAYRENL